MAGLAERADEVPTAAIVVIGNEVLSGKVRDENTPFLVAELRKTPPSGYTPKVLTTLHTGKGAAGVSINKAGTLALVANDHDK